MAWTNEVQPFGKNHSPLLTGLSSADDGTAVPVAVDPSTGAILTETSGGGGVDDVNLTEVNGSPIALGQTTSAASLPVVISSDQSSLTIDTDVFDFKDDFPGTTLNASNWNVTQNGVGMSYSVANSQLSAVAGTTSGDYLVFTSKQTFTLPFRLQIIANASQRITGNNLYIEMVNLSGTQATALAATAVTTGTTQVAYTFNSTVATTGTVVAQNQGVKATVDTAVTVGSTALYTVYEIDARQESVNYATRVTESAAISVNPNTRQRTALDPGEQYYIQIRLLNNATPATSTTFNFESVILEDSTATMVNISGGHGNNSPDKSIIVTPSGGTTTVTASTPTTISGTAGTITTSSSSVTSAVVSSLSGYITVSVHGTYAGVSFGITMSDDSAVTFYNVPVYDTSASQWLAPGATITPGTNASKIYWVPVASATVQVKVLASAYTSGTANIRILPGYGANTPGSIMSQLMDSAGNNRGANVDASGNLNVRDASVAITAGTAPLSTSQIGGLDGTNVQAAGAMVPGEATPNSTGNALLTASTSLMVPYTTTTAQAVAVTDVGNYRSFSVHPTVNGTTSATAIQGSNDNTNWVSIAGMNVASLGTSATQTSASVAGAIIAGPLLFRYFRLNVSGITGGTTAGTVVFSSLPGWSVAGAGIANGSHSVNTTTSGAGNVFVLPTQANAAAQSWTEGFAVPLSSDLKGNTRMRINDGAGSDRAANVTTSNALVVDNSSVSPSLAPASTALNTYSVRITTSTTTTPTAATCYVSSITVVTTTGNAATTLTIQDKSGTPLILIDGLSTTSTLVGNPQPLNFQTPIKMVGGIDIITTGVTPASNNVWINFYQ